LKNIDDFQTITKPEPSLSSQLLKEIDTTLLEVETKHREVNPVLKHLEKWVNIYLGPGTAEFHGMKGTTIPAIRDENRNAVIPSRSTEIDGRTYYLSIKGCGAHEDMFFGDVLTPEKIAAACREPALLPRVAQLRNPSGFIMAESWMGESPYGAQGSPNAHDGLEFSSLTKNASINGAYICPVIGIVPLAGIIEDTARMFYWFRQYPKPFYQEMRLVPSRMRLYFESPHVLADPSSAFAQFHVDTPKQAERFEINFIKSGLSLLSLFLRSAQERDGNISALAYYDIWFDKDAIVAPDGIIHFADIEGLDWRTVPLKPVQQCRELVHSIQRKEWDKLVFEFLFALVQIDAYRALLDGHTFDWAKQRENLSFFIQMSIEKDPFLYTRIVDGSLNAYVESPTFPSIDPVVIPIIQGVKI